MSSSEAEIEEAVEAWLSLLSTSCNMQSIASFYAKIR
jgi:hypothetical protein